MQYVLYVIKMKFLYVTAGYENAAGQWDEYSLYANHEGFDVGSPVSPSCTCYCRNSPEL